MATTNTGRPWSSTTRRSDEHILKNSVKNNYRIQSTPPLSIQQYLRFASGVIAGNKEWQPSGKYRPPPFRLYLSPEARKQPCQSEPIWQPTGPYRQKRPTSLSPEKRKEKTIQEPIWHPPGKKRDKPVSYFDPPSLRWSLQNLLRSMPDMRTKSCRTSSSISNVRQSEPIEET
ncbi:unnamed protein product [Rotaria sordida]|uniref:Uncharacterized protein n=1 Tax=Rotaria sordida TaxID=392033 RepID=A0A814QAU2_9BILA|nr:unnamed protein product [Rotaria sordida]CAF0924838.1 unnamed protein product [Rotaria sordida]CAF0954264.1 unnamed protein product [Rotaria sordida]CAF1009420.1 unnamed protein product [Rotaria sordida]CAF1113737.1 unnamed protein product [Rotaria sordida]